MKTFEEILNNRAKLAGFEDFGLLVYAKGNTIPGVQLINEIIRSAGKSYARECCKATLAKAAGNARCETLYISRVDKESITDESNIVIV